MSRAERAHWLRASAGALVWLCLALIGTGAAASSSTALEVRATPAYVTTSQGVPAVSNCMPCALCYVAPAPLGLPGPGSNASCR
jgi:hypothetical protein